MKLITILIIALNILCLNILFSQDAIKDKTSDMNKKNINCMHQFRSDNRFNKAKTNKIKIDTINNNVYLFVRNNLNNKELDSVKMFKGFSIYVGFNIVDNYSAELADSILSRLSVLNKITYMAINGFSINRISENNTLALNFRNSIDNLFIEGFNSVIFKSNIILQELNFSNDKEICISFLDSNNIIDTLIIKSSNFLSFNNIYRNKLQCKYLLCENDSINEINIIAKQFFANANISSINIKNGVFENLNDNDALSESIKFLQLYACLLNIIPKSWSGNKTFIRAICNNKGKYWGYIKGKDTEKFQYSER